MSGSEQILNRLQQLEESMRLQAGILSEQMAANEALRAAMSAVLQCARKSPEFQAAVHQEFERAYAIAQGMSINEVYFVRLEAEFSEMRANLEIPPPPPAVTQTEGASDGQQ